jgi:hypothetical protein
VASLRVPRRVRWEVYSAVSKPDADEHLCASCKDPMAIDDGCDPTALCHHCAQVACSVMAGYLWRAMRRARKPKRRAADARRRAGR